MSSFSEARNAVAATLTAAGVTPVSLDPRGQPPFVLVDAPSSVAPQNAGSTWNLAIPVRIIAAPPGNAEALDWMLEQLETVLVALDPNDCTARAGTYPVNDKDCPAYLVDVSRQIIVPC
jgi:hypothetical protein